MSLASRLGEGLLSRTSRRGFLARATMAATAASVHPFDQLLRPLSAYEVICQCAGENCSCDQLCCSGYTQFCCTINHGINACPKGTFAGGWWKADGSIYCSGPRYYIDCMGSCDGCGCEGSNFCPGCDGLTCECALGNCDNRHVGCTEFRYGQCHQEITCSGRIACRVVTCKPPWEIDATCSTVAYTDESTADQYAPCQNGPLTYPTPPAPATVAIAPAPSGEGYWLVDVDGRVSAFGDVGSHGDLVSAGVKARVVAMAASPSGSGYWLAGVDGTVYAFGDARFLGSVNPDRLPRPVAGIGADPVTGGYRVVSAIGGVYCFEAPAEAEARGEPRQGSVVGVATTPSGSGYWLVTSTGEVLAFGDALVIGSPLPRLSHPVVGIAASPSGGGYWLVTSAGEVVARGDAPAHGSAKGQLAHPVIGMAATATGEGYWLVTGNGVVLALGDARLAPRRDPAGVPAGYERVGEP